MGRKKRIYWGYPCCQIERIQSPNGSYSRRIELCCSSWFIEDIQLESSWNESSRNTRFQCRTRKGKQIIVKLEKRYRYIFLVLYALYFDIVLKNWSSFLSLPSITYLGYCSLWWLFCRRSHCWMVVENTILFHSQRKEYVLAILLGTIQITRCFQSQTICISGKIFTSLCCPSSSFQDSLILIILLSSLHTQRIFIELISWISRRVSSPSGHLFLYSEMPQLLLRENPARETIVRYYQLLCYWQCINDRPKQSINWSSKQATITTTTDSVAVFILIIYRICFYFLCNFVFYLLIYILLNKTFG